MITAHTPPTEIVEKREEREPEDKPQWASRLDQLGIEHGGIKDASYGSGVSFRDPDGIALEFFAPPAA